MWFLEKGWAEKKWMNLGFGFSSKKQIEDYYKKVYQGSQSYYRKTDFEKNLLSASITFWGMHTRALCNSKVCTYSMKYHKYSFKNLWKVFVNKAFCDKILLMWNNNFLTESTNPIYYKAVEISAIHPSIGLNFYWVGSFG